MAAIQGNTVWNNKGTTGDFSSRDDAWAAYALLCDYEVFLSDCIDEGKTD